MPRLFAFALLTFAIASSASAQIFFEPVQYQYCVEGTTYYYGGSNPAVHAMAAEPSSPGRSWGRVNGLAFGSGNVRSSREVVNEPVRVFTDGWQRGLANAHVVGFTPNDARNDTMANQPRYFAKRDLLASAVRGDDGAWHVSAQAPYNSTVAVYKSSGQRIDPAPKSMPRPLMIIPKDQLNPDRPSDKTVAKAD